MLSDKLQTKGMIINLLEELPSTLEPHFAVTQLYRS